MGHTPLLVAQHLKQRYGTRLALDVEYFALYPGESVGIVGHNGCGKSTLMRLLAFLETPASGQLTFCGQPIWNIPEVPHKPPRSRLVKLWHNVCGNTGHTPCVPRREHDFPALRRQITLLMQTPYLLSRSVFDNVAYGLVARGEYNSSKVHAALEAVGLNPEDFAPRRRHELSGGEAQRVALAARLVLQPHVLLMDEPTTGVDVDSAERIALTVRHAQQAGTTLVVVSHDRDWLDSVVNRTVRLERGRLVEPLP